MSKIIGIITARLKSHARIPDKVLLPLAGETMLWHHIQRMKAAEGLDGVFVATSKYPHNETITDLCDSYGVGYYAGSEHDVIERHIVLCEREGADACIRVPCDSPLFYIDIIKPFAYSYRERGEDYHYVRNVPFECGTMPELISLEAMKKAHEYYQGPAVTLPIWEHMSDFKCVGHNALYTVVRPQYRLDVDTPADYVAMSHIYAALYRGEPIYLPRVFNWLDKHQSIAELLGAAEHSAINRRFMEAQKNAQTT